MHIHEVTYTVFYLFLFLFYIINIMYILLTKILDINYVHILQFQRDFIPQEELEEDYRSDHTVIRSLA